MDTDYHILFETFLSINSHIVRTQYWLAISCNGHAISSASLQTFFKISLIWVAQKESIFLKWVVVGKVKVFLS